MKDSHGRMIDYLRLSVTDRCNLRCRYCMPADGVCIKRHDEMLTEEEMVTAVQKDIVITDLRLLRKSGGVHGNFIREESV